MTLTRPKTLLGAALMACWMTAAWAGSDPTPTVPVPKAVSTVKAPDSGPAKMAPKVRNRKTPPPTPTPNPNLAPPDVKVRKGTDDGSLPALAPATLPNIKFPDHVTPTPTPEPGLIPKDPTAAALFSVFLPGLGHAYCKEPLKGVFFAAAFGISLYLSIDNFRLESEPNSDERVARNETAGSLYGLAALAAYGFSVQDAYNSARRYNRRHYLSVSFEPSPYPQVAMKVSF
jgi:hypothetical protein